MVPVCWATKPSVSVSSLPTFQDPRRQVSTPRCYLEPKKQIRQLQGASPVVGLLCCTVYGRSNILINRDRPRRKPRLTEEARFPRRSEGWNHYPPRDPRSNDFLRDRARDFAQKLSHARRFLLRSDRSGEILRGLDLWKIDCPPRVLFSILDTGYT